MKSYLRNPLTLYLRFLWNRAENRRRFLDFEQGYMALVTESFCEPHVKIGAHCGILKSRIGACSYLSTGATASLATIGKFCSIGPGCRIGVGIHPLTYISTNPAFFSTRGQTGISFTGKDLARESKEIIIGNDVWVGADVLVLDGVKIGTGAVVAAGAVVRHDVEPFTLVAGVPAVPKKKRFTEERIMALLESRWWDWSEEELAAWAPLFLDPDRFFEELSSRSK